jgi:hypothetical protein
MGIGFTIDSPLKVAHLGIDSVISLVDDILIEKMRKMYCQKYQLPYEEISAEHPDYRAQRITCYLNMLKDLVEQKFDAIKFSTIEKMEDLRQYFKLLPDNLPVKQEFEKLSATHFNFGDFKAWAVDKLSLGSIDVNIMTKVDKDNYLKNEQLPVEFNDAHAALRGFANSSLSSSLILSAGMNPRLYSYIEQFEDFYPNAAGQFNKKIVLKVSDYRSALIQGKFLAKKGIWISEYRIESGLNCGGHAFATDGYLMGPILEEFKNKRSELIVELQTLLTAALQQKGKVLPETTLSVKISAQGGVGTHAEHEFLLDYYNVDSVGWGTPFLLVPEVCNVDEPTLEKLVGAKEEDLFLSGISPLGVPFNSLRGNTKDEEKLSLISKGRPGSACPKKFVALNKEFSETGICTASREYQYQKLKALDAETLSAEEFQLRYDKIVEKSCTCVGLGTSALLVNGLSTKVEGTGVSICPGPNMAYFSKIMTLNTLVDHIYGRINVISRTDRPNMFVKELQIYIDYLSDRFEESKYAFNAKQEKYFLNFMANLNDGIAYYNATFSGLKDKLAEAKESLLTDLESCKQRLNALQQEIKSIAIA